MQGRLKATALPLCERLRDLDCDEISPCLGTWADEAADTIEQLYEALNELVATSYSSPQWQDICTNAMDALAKARGEQP